VVIHNPADAAQDADIRLQPGDAGFDPTDLSKLNPQFLPRNAAGTVISSPVDSTNPALPVYRIPTIKALYLQLFHSLSGASVCINGRTFLGNTPTMVGGPATLMRFGVVGMGSEFHTFHIHGHRWVIPGPSGSVALQLGGPMNTPVSQFEDTKTFGPANSFSFTISEGAGFMRAANPLGEWHMHCHVLMHMMTGMMGSLLVVNDGQAVTDLPMGLPCPEDDATTGTAPASTIVVTSNVFTPNNISVPSGTVVTFDFQATFHTVTTMVRTGIINSIEINGGAAMPNIAADSGVTTPLGPRTVTMTGNMGDKIDFQCGIHFAPMEGSITIM
jgi:plastocyanin